MNSKYEATFGINHGVTNGVSICADYIEISKLMPVDSEDNACRYAMLLAEKFASEYLSNPLTGKTTGSVVALKGPHGKIFFDPSKAVVVKGVLEHILELDGEQDIL